jgi:hypothetical protein
MPVNPRDPDAKLMSSTPQKSKYAEGPLVTSPDTLMQDPSGVACALQKPSGMSPGRPDEPL